jgi:hypothetical protein
VKEFTALTERRPAPLNGELQRKKLKTITVTPEGEWNKANGITQ